MRNQSTYLANFNSTWSDCNWKPARDELIDAKSIKINLTALDTGKNYFFRICTQVSIGVVTRRIPEESTGLLNYLLTCPMTLNT